MSRVAATPGDARATPEVRDLGRMEYAAALALQRDLQQRVIAARAGGSDDDDDARRGFLLLLEHDPPVITVTKRRGADAHVIATDAMLAAAGVALHATDRGGDVTYHGPGQLVVYPILDLNRHGLRLHEYLRFLEEVVIETLAAFGVAGHRDAGATGVWVGEAPADRKICAMGVRVSRWVSMHGLALNVSPDLAHFDLIVPCGLHGRAVTSLAREAGAAPPMDEVKRTLTERFLDRLPWA